MRPLPSSAPATKKPRLQVGRLIGVLLGCYVVSAAVLVIEQDKVILHPPPAGSFKPLGPQPWVVSTPSAKPIATVVVFHGNAGAAEHRQYIWRPLTELGYRVVVLEYPGFAGRPGKATVPALADQAGADFNHVRQTFPTEPIIVLGESFGAGLAAQIAGQSAGAICGAVLITPWYSLAALAQEAMPLYPSRYLVRRQLNSQQALAKFPGALTIVGALQDRVIPVRHAQQLLKELPHAKGFFLQGMGHNDWGYRTTKETWRSWMPACEEAATTVTSLND